MSLRLWLPFDGNMNNYGADKISMSGTALSYENGKIGKCIKFGPAANRLMSTTKINLSNEISISFWIKIASWQAWGPIFYITNADGLNGYYCCLNTASDGRIGNCIDVNDRDVSTAYSANISDLNWHHIVFTVKGTTTRHYLDGVSLGYWTLINGVPSNLDYTVYVGGSNGDGYSSSKYMYINDFRIYDHELSPKEVKEISKALIVHYPLNNQYESGQVNKYSGVEAEGCTGPGSFTRTKLVGERGYNYKLTRTGTGSNSYPNMDASAFTFTPGKTYFYSVKVRCNKWTKGNLNLRAARSNNDWVTNSTQVCNPTLADGKWHEYYVSQIVNETYVRSGSTVTCSPRLEFYSSNQNAEGTVYDMDFDIKDIQVIESDNYVPFIQNEYATNIVADTSGYKKNGKSSGTLVINTDTPRYNCCSVFNGTDSFIACGRGGMITGATAITLSFWCYSSDWTTINKIVSCTQQGGYNVSKEGSNLYWIIGTGTSSNTYVQVNAGALSNISAGWHYIAATYNGLAGKIYLDGVLKATTTKYTTITPLYFHSSNGVFIGAEAGTNQTTPAGEYTACKISDFRIYATALSEEDIKELYQNSASVSKNGSLICYEVKEV